jgi:O-antigen/teichoic acid export membrane protein
LGIWSLVLATTSATQVANLGLSGSVVKFVAKYVARNEDKNVSGVIQTAGISLGVIIGFVLLAGYPLIKWVLDLVLPHSSLGFALNILLYALFSLWLAAITGIFQSGLDGLQRIYIRNLLVMGGSIFFALLCLAFAPKYGLIGLAFAQIINNSTILIISWILIKRFLPVLPIIPYQWNKDIFKEIINYGINFQIISVATMLYDPVTKALLSKFGGLSMVGYYEMANKMILQFRALIVSANQVLVPAIADLKEKAPEKIQAVYMTSYKLLFYLSSPLFSLMVAFIPTISRIWIVHYEKIFIIFGILLTIGWLLNIFAGPAYFANLGTGKLRYNVISHIIIGLLNAGLGFLLGIFYGGIGVVIGWVISLSIGSSVIYISYHIIESIPLKDLFPEEGKKLFLSCLFFVVVSITMQSRFLNRIDVITSSVILLFLFLIIVFFPFWFHPMRKQLMEWISNELFNKKVELK